MHQMNDNPIVKAETKGWANGVHYKPVQTFDTDLFEKTSLESMLLIVDTRDFCIRIVGKERFMKFLKDHNQVAEDGETVLFNKLTGKLHGGVYNDKRTRFYSREWMWEAAVDKNDPCVLIIGDRIDIVSSFVQLDPVIQDK